MTAAKAPPPYPPPHFRGTNHPRQTRRGERGSAYIFVILLVITITTVGLSLADLSMAYVKSQRRLEAAAKTRLLFDGVLAQIDSINKTNPIVALPTNVVATIRGTNVNCTLTDGSAEASNSIKVTATISDGGYSYTRSGFVSMTRYSPFEYAIAVNKNFSTAQAVITGSGGANGDIFANGNISVLALLTVVNGNADATGTSNATLVSGSKRGSLRAMSFPNPIDTDYQTAATTTLSGNQTLNGYTFPAVAAGQPYPIVYISGSLTFKGAITNVGTFYATGLISFNGNVTYANASSRVAFITGNNITWGAFNVVGYMYAKGNFTSQGLSGTNSSGSLAAAGNVVINRATTVTLDPTVRDDPLQGYLLHLPVYWP